MQSLKKELLIVFIKDKSKGGQKGVAIFLALMIMSILLAIGLGLSVIIISQEKLMKNISDSVTALYVADTGIEAALYDKRIGGGDGVITNGDLTPDCISPVCAYDVTVDYPGDDKGYWTSIGTYKKSKRSIEAQFFTTP